jgi:hypothetical protein
VINGARPVVVMISAGNAVGAWLIPANSSLLLVAGPEALGGLIEIRAVPTASDSCALLANASFKPGSWTLILTGPEQGAGYRMTLQPGVSMAGPASTDYSPACSG